MTKHTQRFHCLLYGEVVQNLSLVLHVAFMLKVSSLCRLPCSHNVLSSLRCELSILQIGASKSAVPAVAHVCAVSASDLDDIIHDHAILSAADVSKAADSVLFSPPILVPDCNQQDTHNRTA